MFHIVRITQFLTRTKLTLIGLVWLLTCRKSPSKKRKQAARDPVQIRAFFLCKNGVKSCHDHATATKNRIFMRLFDIWRKIRDAIKAVQQCDKVAYLCENTDIAAMLEIMVFRKICAKIVPQNHPASMFIF